MAETQRTLSLLDLNQDVLIEILSWLSTSDVLRLMLTSRAIEPLALQRALSRVEIRSPVRCEPFLEYMLSPIQGRLYYLQDLTLPALQGFLKARVICSRLADLLAQTQNLRRLSLCDSQYLLGLVPRIGQEICALASLDSLSLLKGGSLTLALFPKLRSKPTKIVHQLAYDSEPEDPDPDHSVLLTSSALSHTKTLCITWFDAAACKYAPVEAWTIAPSLHHLYLSTSDAPMSAFARAFPNLRTLRIYHVRSQETQHGSSTCWSSLDQVSGEVLSLRYWPISCPVHILELYTTFGRASSDPDEIAVILRTVQNTSPVILKLTAAVHITAPELWVPLARIAPRLTSLEIGLEEWDGPHAKLLTGWVDTIPQVLSSLKLVCIRIRIRVTGMRWDYMQDDELPGEARQRVLCAISETLPTSLAQNIRPLQYIFIRAMKHISFWDTDQQWRWRAVEAEGHRAVEAISLEEEMRVIGQFL